MGHLALGAGILSGLDFREALWLFPIVFLAHILEEWRGFTLWARRYASESYTRRDYVVVHLAGVSVALATAAIVSVFPNRLVVAVSFALVFAPNLLFNTVFHVGATLVNRRYCPGVITALALYVPTFVLITSLAWQEGLLEGWSFGAALLIGGSFHTWEVGHNVFRAW